MWPIVLPHSHTMEKVLLQHKIEKMDEISKNPTGRCDPFPLRPRGIHILTDGGEKERELQQHPLALKPSTPGPSGTLLPCKTCPGWTQSFSQVETSLLGLKSSPCSQKQVPLQILTLHPEHEGDSRTLPWQLALLYGTVNIFF